MSPAYDRSDGVDAASSIRKEDTEVGTVGLQKREATGDVLFNCKGFKPGYGLNGTAQMATRPTRNGFRKFAAHRCEESVAMGAKPIVEMK